jgi:hypothetical protein
MYPLPIRFPRRGVWFVSVGHFGDEVDAVHQEKQVVGQARAVMRPLFLNFGQKRFHAFRFCSFSKPKYKTGVASPVFSYFCLVV